MNPPFIRPLLTLFIGAFIPVAFAQERSALGSMEAQMSWTAFRKLSDQANGNATNAHVRVDQIVTCNRKAMLYAPGGGSDTDGCIENSKIAALNVQINNINAQISKINSGISELNDRIGKAESRLATINGTLSSQANQIKDLYNRNDDLNNRTNDLINKTNDLYNNLNNIYNLINNTNRNANDINHRVNAVNGQITSANSQIGDLYNRTNDLYNRSRSGARWYFVGDGGQGIRNLDWWSQSQGFQGRCYGSQGVVGRLCGSSGERCYKFASEQWRNENNDSSHSGTTTWAQLFACE